MPNFLTASASTALSDVHELPSGTHKFLVECDSGDTPSVEIFQRSPGNTDWMPVSSGGSAVALTVDDPGKLIVSSGEEFAVQNAGSGTISVTSRQVSNTV